MTSLHDVMSTRVDNSSLPEGRLQSPIAPKGLKSSETQNFSSIYQVNTFYKLAYRLQLKDLKGFGKF